MGKLFSELLKEYNKLSNDTKLYIKIGLMILPSFYAIAPFTIGYIDVYRQIREGKSIEQIKPVEWELPDKVPIFIREYYDDFFEFWSKRSYNTAVYFHYRKGTEQ